jgi:tight adherence protein C
MELALSATLFVLIAAAMAVAGVRLWARPKAAIERVTGTVVEADKHVPVHPSLVFQNLVKRIGMALPVSPSETGVLQKRLIRAGYRNPSAPRMFRGAKVLLAAVLPLAAWLAALGWVSDSGTLWMVVAGAAGLGYSAPGYWLGWMVRRRQRRIRRGLADALDLLVICVESGLGLDQALMQSAKELELAHPAICEEFALVNLEMKAGKRRVEALRNLGERTAVDELKKLVAVLIQADRFGTSVAQTLRTHSDFMRVQARQRAEEKAAKLGVKLVFPIFFCILPTLFVVTVGPMVVRIMRELLPMMHDL